MHNAVIMQRNLLFAVSGASKNGWKQQGRQQGKQQGKKGPPDLIKPKMLLYSSPPPPLLPLLPPLASLHAFFHSCVSAALSLSHCSRMDSVVASGGRVNALLGGSAFIVCDGRWLGLEKRMQGTLAFLRVADGERISG